MLSSFRSRALGSILSHQAAPVLTMQQRFRYKDVNPRLIDPYEADEAEGTFFICRFFLYALGYLVLFLI